MRVVLIAPFFEDFRYPLYFPSENLGLGYLAAVLRDEGIETDIVDANMLGVRAEELPPYIGARRYDLVGIAIPFEGAVHEARRLAETAAAMWPSAHITAGGHFPTFAHLALLRADRFIRSVVRQDGEDTLLDLARALETGRDLRTVSGLSFKTDSGQVVAAPPRRPRDDLDSLPWPARDTLRHVRERGHVWPTQICSSRGCYAGCAFCDISVFYEKCWRARDPVRVVDEIEHLQEEFGSRVFRFTDDQFIGPPGEDGGRTGPARARRIAQEITRRRLEVELMIDARADLVTSDLFEELAAAGVVDCLVGVESGVDRILELYYKGTTVRVNEQAIQCLKRLGIHPTVGFIMFDPRMSLGELRANYDFLLRNDVATAENLKSRLWPLSGTPVVGELREQGLILEESLGEVRYRFADAAVGRIFETVSECARRTFPVEQALFHARLDGTLSAAQSAAMSETILRMWCRILSECLGGASLSALGWVDDTADELRAGLGVPTSKVRGGRGR